MGTAPNGYQAPKTTWAAGNVPTAADFNRVEGNIQAIEENLRTIDPVQAPTSNQGSLRQFLDWLTNRIKAITGKTNWYDAPDITLADLKAHKSRHASGGADALTPADIGAVNKAGDTMTGILTINRSVPEIDFVESDTGKKYLFVFDGSSFRIQEDSYTGIEAIAYNPVAGVNALKTRSYTVWHEGNDGAGSGLDADTVRGRNIVSDVDEVDYNVYQLMLQMYYDGKAPLKQGLIFDGFADTSMVDSANTTPHILDTTNRKINLTTTMELVSQKGYGQTDQAFGSYSSNAKVAQTFVIPSSNPVISSISVKIGKYGSPTDNVTCSIYTTNGGVPDSLVATATNQVSGSSLSTSSTICTFNFNNISLSGDTTYAIVLSRTGSISSSNYYMFAASDASSYPSGKIYFFDSSSSTWGAYNSAYDLYFVVNGQLVYLNATYQTTEQVFTNSFDNAYLYLKAKQDTGVSITPQIAVYSSSPSFNTMALKSSTVLSDGYTEYKYYLDVTSGNKIKLKLVFSRTDTSKICEVKSYGVLLGVV